MLRLFQLGSKKMLARRPFRPVEGNYLPQPMTFGFKLAPEDWLEAFFPSPENRRCGDLTEAGLPLTASWCENEQRKAYHRRRTMCFISYLR